MREGIAKGRQHVSSPILEKKGRVDIKLHIAFDIRVGRFAEKPQDIRVWKSLV